MPSVIFNSCLFDVCSGDIDFKKDRFAVMLASADYSPLHAAHSRRSHVSGEISGTGYRAGGQMVEIGVQKTRDAVKVIFGKAIWNPATIRARYAIYYKRRGGAATRDELVAAIDFDDDISATNSAFMLSETTLRLQNAGEQD